MPQAHMKACQGQLFATCNHWVNHPRKKKINMWNHVKPPTTHVLTAGCESHPKRPSARTFQEAAIHLRTWVRYPWNVCHVQLIHLSISLCLAPMSVFGVAWLFLFANASLWSGNRRETGCNHVRWASGDLGLSQNQFHLPASLKHLPGLYGAFHDISGAEITSENKGYPEKIDKQMNDEGFQGVHHVRTRSGFW